MPLKQMHESRHYIIKRGFEEGIDLSSIVRSADSQEYNRDTGRIDRTESDLASRALQRALRVGPWGRED